MAIACTKPDKVIVAVSLRRVSSGCYGNPTYCSGANSAFLPAITVCRERFFTGNEPVINSGTSALAPVADFSANPTSGQSPLVVQFTDNSTKSPTSWLWTFGDNQTSTQQNPQHTYASPGFFSVRLKATNQYGSSNRTGIISATSQSNNITNAGNISSAEAFGTAVVTTGIAVISPTGISSAEAFGTTVVTGGTPIVFALNFSDPLNSQYLPLM